MQTNGELNQEQYWIYICDKTGKYACLCDDRPYKLAAFSSQADGLAFVDAYALLAPLRGHWVSKQELRIIAEIDFGGNYILLEQSDILLLKSRVEHRYGREFPDVPEG